MRKLITSIFIFLSAAVFAQTENTMFFMKQLPQSTYSNPAFIPDYKVSVMLPSAFVSFANTGFSYNSIFTKKSYADGDSLIIDLDKFYSSLNDKNYIDVVANAEILGVGFRAGRSHITFNINEKVRSRFMYPKDLFGLFIKGNGELLGQTLNFSPAIDAYSYLEVALGGSYLVDKNLTVGGRVKFLRGQGSVSTKYSDLTLTTNQDDYSMTISADALIQTSGVNQFIDDNDDEIDPLNSILTENKGIAFDLGATYRINNKLTAGLSIIDIGNINWKQDIKSYQLDKSKATYTFEGIDVAEAMNDDGESFESLADSLQKLFKPEETNGASFVAWLPAKAYGSLTYRPMPSLTIGAMLNLEKFQNRTSAGFSASVHQKLGIVGLSLSYSMMNKTYDNFGAGFTLKLGPVQTYLISDNLLGAAVAVASKGEVNSYVNNVQNLNFRVGMNLVFSKLKSQEKQSFTPSKAKMR